MNLKNLRIFCEAVALRSVSRAAEAAGVSQSTASQALAHLEQHLGVTLLDRSKRPLAPTVEGWRFYEGCRELVERYEALEEAIRTGADELSGVVRVAAIYSVGLGEMKSISGEFARRHPAAQVEMSYRHPDEVYEAVVRDEADLGLVSFPRSSRRVEVLTWCEEPMAVVCSPEHPLADRTHLSIRELDGLDMIGFDSDLRIRRKIDAALAQAGAKVRITLAFDNVENIKRAVESLGGVSLLPTPTAAREQQTGALKLIPLDKPGIVRPLGVISRRGKPLGRAADHFRQFLLEKSSDHLAVQTQA